jgi:hypothetical protein
MLRFRCPYCDATLTVKESEAGGHAPCPGCRQAVEVPRPEPVLDGKPDLQPGEGGEPSRSAAPQEADWRPRSPTRAILVFACLGFLILTALGGLAAWMAFRSAQAEAEKPSASAGTQDAQNGSNGGAKPLAEGAETGPAAAEPVAAEELLTAFATNPDGAARKYVGRRWKVRGKVRFLTNDNTRLFVEGTVPGTLCFLFAAEVKLPAADEVVVEGMLAQHRVSYKAPFLTFDNSKLAR